MSRNRNSQAHHGMPTALKATALLGVVAIVIWGISKYDTSARNRMASIEMSEVTAEDHPLVDVKVPPQMPQELIKYPGFTVSFNPEAHIPNYVSWELTGEESRSTKHKRSNNFAPDPRIKGCATLADYQRARYDRGHMAPAGDMKWSQDAMDACFLLTNILPQNRTLNSGAWNNLEISCRNWARRDSAIIIVCGPVLTDSITRHIGDSRVAVPERLFKVILSPYSNPPKGIGFIMANTAISDGVQNCAVSIDEVEEITGLDFFWALPDDIEQRVESECNYAKWTRK